MNQSACFPDHSCFHDLGLPRSLFCPSSPSALFCPLAPFPHSLAQRATDCSQPGMYPPEGLPPPEMLCRRKRRRPHLAGMQQGPGGIPARVRAVTYHLEDLRRRQRIINELKKAQWGSSGVASEPLVPDEAGCGLPSTTEYPGLEEERASYPREEDHFLPPGRDQLLWSPWSPLGQEGSCLSRQLSSLPHYSSVTASRNPLYNLWGMKLQSEE
nr:PREDICTED: protein INCA1 isoform X2 [Rhinolophus sinicus]XP_019570664.1 PREDICTED: protein INCA1 isoform X2 [Rhinolophus sinicus]